MQNILFIFIFLSLAIFSGCGEDHNKTNKNSTFQKDFIYKTIVKGDVPYDYEEYMSGEKSFLLYDSKNPEDIVAFEKEYLLLTGDQAPIFDGMMIIAKMGTHSSGGYGISVESMQESSNSIDVKLYLATPKNDDFVTMAFTNPFIIVSIDNIHKKIVFKESY